jgi:DNA-binding transcriptional MocR family regulator
VTLKIAQGSHLFPRRQFPQPFDPELILQPRVKPIFVDIGDLSDLTTLAGVRRHEETILESQRNGVKIKGLLLCNPHNPLGRCYPPNVIKAYLSLCSKYSIHFISDEIYAMSVFPTSDVQDMVPFTSVLSLDVAKFIDPGLVHVLYTMSKVVLLCFITTLLVLLQAHMADLFSSLR